MEELIWTAEDSLKLVEWACSLKPGDIFGACSAFNHRVESIAVYEFKYNSDDPNDVIAVNIEDTAGQHHHIEYYGSGHSGCICYPYSLEEIKDYFLNELNYQEYADNGWDSDGKAKRIIDAIQSGDYPFDKDGILKEEFK